MSVAASPGSDPAAPLSGKLAPRSIRGRLLPEDAGDFDREYRRVMAEATETLDLKPVLDALTRWERVAFLTERDPEAYRRMLRTAERLNAGEDVETIPWEQVKRELGL
ncbi:hypothetical protein GCM10022223_20130 [Kineosporia mesophila]|uniref:Prevent-host-death family protein n=1 Tax=Kineosporia mesophila TaxID=566012 RepID=A0ABP6ZBI3_9ACTN|nr:DUF6247 family protein [Kineosporia mesophila]MCD5350110.1 DUF6247 family protein [Kineosporia mesophila]